MIQPGSMSGQKVTESLEMSMRSVFDPSFPAK
jgi:hypothetical protein